MNLSKEETFEAIKQGVKEAFHEMMDSGNGINGTIRTEEVMRAIREGVLDSFPSHSDVFVAIKDGVNNGMPYPEQTLNAIYDATHEALKNVQ